VAILARRLPDLQIHWLIPPFTHCFTVHFTVRFTVRRAATTLETLEMVMFPGHVVNFTIVLFPTIDRLSKLFHGGFSLYGDKKINTACWVFN
jgi:hypothetical protein